MPISIPPFTNVPAPDDPVASAWAQQLTQFVVDDITIGAVAPTNPDAEVWYDTADSGVSFPNMPRGWVGGAVASSALTAVTGTQDIPGCTVTWTADPTRRYKTTLVIPYVVLAAANGGFYGHITNAGSTQIKSVMVSPNGAANATAAGHLTLVETGLSGATTRKGRVTSITGAITTHASPEYAPYILVEDIGGV